METTEEIRTEETISNEDKMLALFCHLSMVFGGILLPIIIWAIKKDKSKFVRFHSLQSIFYHIAYAVIVGVIAGVAIAIIFLSAGILGSQYHTFSRNLPVFFVPAMIAIGLFIAFAVLVSIAYSIYLAIKSYQGEKIKIPVIGKIIYEKVYGKI